MSFSIAEDELRSIRPELTTGHYCSWNYFQSIDTPANRRFVRAFRQRYGADRVTDDPIEAAYSQVHLFAKAVEKAGSTEIDAIRRAARGLIFAAPGGLIRIDPRNQHTWKVSRIGQIQPNGQVRITWSSGNPLPPRPYLPETFLAEAITQGEIMFQGISTMIDLEIAESADGERNQLVGLMADVQGVLGDARPKFHSAVLAIQPRNRVAFEEAWDEFERRSRIWLMIDSRASADSATIVKFTHEGEKNNARVRTAIADKIDEHLPQPRGIAVHPMGNGRVNVPGQFEVLGTGAGQAA